MWNASAQQVHTAHTTNLVPLIYIGKQTVQFKKSDTTNYALQDVAPTMLDLLQLPQPAEMKGTSLIERPVTT